MSDDIALLADRVSVSLGSATIVRDADVQLTRGRLTILVGPNGAGKTTLVRALAGLIPSRGTIRLGDREIASISVQERARQIGYLPQGNVFHWPISVAAVVELGRYPHGDPFTSPTDRDREAVHSALVATGTEAFAARPVTSLSGGERARVALARVLATQAPVILADEPTVSLDARHQLVVLQLLRDAARRGGAILAVLHDLSLAARFADEVILMQTGTIVAHGQAKETLTASVIADAFGVDVAMIEMDGATIPVPRRPL